MTVIVTGGAGFIGSNFVYHMLSAHPDYRIVCIDCLTYAGNMSTLAKLGFFIASAKVDILPA